MADEIRFVEGLRDVALMIGRGLVAVYAWDWGQEDGSREEWQARLDDAALDEDIVIYFLPLPAKRMTVAYNADNPPPKGLVEMAVRTVERLRDLDQAVPSAQDVALVHQHVPRPAL